MKTVVSVLIAGLFLAAPAQAKAPTLNRRVVQLEAQVRVLKAQVAAMDARWRQTAEKLDAHATCNVATVYDALAKMYASFGQQLASLQGKVLTPATLPPFDSGDACKVANG